MQDPPVARNPERWPGNLPLELTSFVGREREVAEVKRLLNEKHLLTLTGPGGCGKTRLALAAAFEVVESFEDGVWWVGLASLSDPDLVPQVVASSLDVREAPGRTLTEVLVEHLKTKNVLLVLDNCEHLIDACAALAHTLLRSCPDLRVLATSRESLSVAGEMAWPVPPLSAPDSDRVPSLEELGRYEAVRLFVERARSATPSFEMTEENAGAVMRVCRRLDGNPLAIELAAARARSLSVEQILKRLEDSLKLLTSGGRTALPRQRTLRATLDWSHELLGEDEQVFFRRLSVFAGGWTLETAEAVCAAEGIEEDDVLDLLSLLVNKSLVVTEAITDDELRYRMLEPVRQYAWEKLETSGEATAVQRRHATFFLRLAQEEADPISGEQEAWLKRLQSEHDNLRAALRWALSGGEEAQQQEEELALGLAAAMWPFWYTRGHLSEGSGWLEGAISRSSGASEAKHAKAEALNGAGYIALFQGEYEAAKGFLEQSLALYRQLEDKEGIASSLTYLGFVAVLSQRDLETIPALYEEAMALREQIEDRRVVANLLLFSGLMAVSQGDMERAVALHEECLILFREIRDVQGIGHCLNNLALAALMRGGYDETSALIKENLRLARESEYKLAIQYSLFGLGMVAAAQGRPARAARLWGAEEAMREAFGIQITPLARTFTNYEGYLASARARLDEASWEAAWSEGRAMKLEEAIKHALNDAPAPSAEPVPPTKARPAPKEDEEREAPSHELLRIYALGQSRVEVAEGQTRTPSDFGYAKPRELLFYLLSHPPRTREQIGLALWPEASPSQLRKTFHNTLYHLRRALGKQEWISYEGGRYSFERSSGYFYDAEAFETNLVEAMSVKEQSPEQAIARLQEAVELYRGDFLEEFLGSEWVLSRQEELRREYGEALRELGGMLFSEGRFAEAAEAYRKVISHERYSEAAHRHLMRCYARMGERGRALKHYERLVELLSEELGAKPAPESEALYEALRKGQEV